MCDTSNLVNKNVKSKALYWKGKQGVLSSKNYEVSVGQNSYIRIERLTAPLPWKNLMTQCWSQAPHERPSAKKCYMEIKKNYEAVIRL